MSEETCILKVGMYLYYQNSYGYGTDRIKLTRETPTTVVAEAKRPDGSVVILAKFDKTYTVWDGRPPSFIAKGDTDKWHKTHYFLETPEWIDRYNHSIALAQINRIAFKTLSTDQLERIVAIAQEAKGD